MIITPETPIKLLDDAGRSPYLHRLYLDRQQDPPRLPCPWIESSRWTGMPDCHSTTAGTLHYWWKADLTPWVAEEDGRAVAVNGVERAATRLRVVAPVPHWEGATTLRQIAMTTFLTLSSLPDYLPPDAPLTDFGYFCAAALELSEGRPADTPVVARCAESIARWASVAGDGWRFARWKGIASLLDEDPTEGVFAACALGEALAPVPAHFRSCYAAHVARRLTTGYRSTKEFREALAKR